MRITIDYRVNKVRMDTEFKICPSCGYKDGFHSPCSEKTIVKKPGHNFFEK